jgi:hypothetical protein
MHPGRGSEIGQQGAKAPSVIGGDVCSERFAAQEAGGNVQQPRSRLIGLAHNAAAVGNQVCPWGKVEQLLVAPPLAVELQMGEVQLLVLLPQLLFGNPELFQGDLKIFHCGGGR